MQINLIPKTREQEAKRKKINSIIILSSLMIVSAIAVLSIVFYSINLTKKNSIKKEESKISSLREDIEKYKDVENYVSSLVSGYAGINDIIGGRKDLTFVYRHLQALLPREVWLSDIEMSSGKAFFKLNSVSALKLTEAIKTLEDYTAEPAVSQIIVEDDKKDEIELPKVKMFGDIQVIRFVKNTSVDSIYYECSIELNIMENIWISS